MGITSHCSLERNISEAFKCPATPLSSSPLPSPTRSCLLPSCPSHIPSQAPPKVLSLHQLYPLPTPSHLSSEIPFSEGPALPPGLGCPLRARTTSQGRAFSWWGGRCSELKKPERGYTTYLLGNRPPAPIPNTHFSTVSPRKWSDSTHFTEGKTEADGRERPSAPPVRPGPAEMKTSRRNTDEARGCPTSPSPMCRRQGWSSFTQSTNFQEDTHHRDIQIP